MFHFPKAVIFDLDGTLADSLLDIAEAMNEALSHNGFSPHPLDAYRLMVGEGVHALVARATHAADETAKRRVLEHYQHAYQRNAHRNSFPYPGIVVLLEALQQHGVPMAVLSNKRDDFTKHLVATRLGNVSFVEVRGERNGVPRKPDPTAALALAGLMQRNPSEVTFVGDTAVDMQTASAASMIGVGVTWGFRGRDELITAKATRVIDAPMQLLELPL